MQLPVYRLNTRFLLWLLLFSAILLPAVRVLATNSVAGHRPERKVIFISGHEGVPLVGYYHTPFGGDIDAWKTRQNEATSWQAIIRTLRHDPGDADSSPEEKLVELIGLTDNSFQAGQTQREFLFLSYAIGSENYERVNGVYDFGSPLYQVKDTCLNSDPEASKRRNEYACIIEQDRITRVAANITEILQAYPNAEFDIIGHSQGGTIAAYWAATQSDPALVRRVNAIITINSPLQGEGEFCAGPLPKCWELVGQDTRTTLREAPNRIPIYTLRNVDDGVVGWHQSTLPGAWNDSQADIRIPGESGNAFGHDPRTDEGVQRRIAATLIGGKLATPQTNRPLLIGEGGASTVISLFKPTFTGQELGTDDFGTTIGGVDTQIRYVAGGRLGGSAYQSDNLIRLLITPPILPNQIYDLSVDSRSTHLEAGPNPLDIRDTESQSVHYGQASHIAVVLILDRSGSMGGEPLQAAKDAAKLFIDFLEVGDQVGVVSFATTAQMDFSLTTITSDSTRTAAKNAVDALTASGETSIGAGLELGLAELVANAAPFNLRSMVLLSDGAQNRPPSVATVLPSVVQAGVGVNTIALGSGADAPLMQTIAEATGGRFRFAPTPDELLEVYNDVLATLLGAQRLVAASGSIEPLGVATLPIGVDGNALQATFLGRWDNPQASVQMTLRAPNGVLFTPTSQHPDVRVVQGSTFTFYRVQSPAQFGTGLWLMTLTRGASLAAGATSYTALVNAQTPLTMEVRSEREQYLELDPIRLAAILNEGEPVLGASTTALITPPSGSSYTLALYDDGLHQDEQAGDGIYANTITDAAQVGVYTAHITANGTSTQAGTWSRIADFSLAVADNPAPPADLYVALSDPVAEPNAHYRYTVTIGNQGPGVANDVVLTSFFSREVTIVGSTLGGGQPIGNVGRTWSLGTLPAASETTFTLIAAIPPGGVSDLHLDVTLLSQPTSSTAWASPDPNLANNSQQVSIELSGPTVYLPLMLQGGVPTPTETPTPTRTPTATPTSTPSPSPTPTATPGSEIVLVSRANDGTLGNDFSSLNTLSADGRYVAFYSRASNLVSGDTNSAGDIFAHDRLSRQVTRVSVASNGGQSNQDSYGRPVISVDGRYVIFTSSASNLVEDDTNGYDDVFVHDRQTGQTTRISVASNGFEANGHSSSGAISSDGRYIVFDSRASTLVSGDTNGATDVFVHDQHTSQTTRVSMAFDGSEGNGTSYNPSLSADGRYVAFTSSANNLVSDDTNQASDIFVYDRQSGQTTRVSVASNGDQGDQWSALAMISADGRYVAFDSFATTLVSGDTNDQRDMFVHDRQSGQTVRVSVAADGTQGDGWSYNPYISADGRYIVFDSFATNLVPGNAKYFSKVLLYDQQSGQLTLLASGYPGYALHSPSLFPSISANGRFIAFASAATHVMEDTNGISDVFVYDQLFK